MFEKVLIAEDQESASISVRKTVGDLGIGRPEYSYYCDDALLALRRGLREQAPVELLITDLYFEQDHRAQVLAGGAELIAAARALQPELKVLVFSAEPKAAVIDRLFRELHIDGYVRKARFDAQELKMAMETIWQGKRHLPAELRQAVRLKNTYEFTEFDITIIRLLAEGLPQKDIPAYLQQNAIRPSGLSSLEKRLNHIREALDFSKNEQLVAFCKDMGII